MTSPKGIDRYTVIVILAIGVFSLFFSLFSLYRLSVFDPQYDTVIFNQAYWNTIHYGEILTNSFEMGSHFGVHFSPILFTILPLYYLAPSPETLFVVKSVLIALGVIPIFICAREVISPKVGCIISLIYFLYPTVQGAAYCDFYETSFIPLLLGLALWSYLTHRENMMVLFCILCLLIKEDVCLIIMMIGMVGLWMNRKRPLNDNWRYLFLIVLSVILLFGFLYVVKPAFSTGNVEAANQFLNQYKDIPGNLSDQNGKRITYLFQMFLPLLFVPLAAPSVLVIAIPSFLEILLSPNPDYFYVGQHYSALVIPVIFMAFIYGFRKISEKKFIRTIGSEKLLYLILFCSIISTIMWSPFSPPLQYAFEGKHIPTWNHSPDLHRIIGIIPEDVPLASPMNILPFLTNRHDLYLKYQPEAEIILLDSNLPEYEEEIVGKMRDISSDYIRVFNQSGISLYVRNDKDTLKRLISGRLSSM